MSYKLEIYSGVTWYDVSAFVTSISPVPIISRNVNYEIKADTFSCSVSASYNGSTIGNNSRLNAATYVRFGTGGVVYFLGKINKKNLNYDNHTHEYEILNAIIDLDDYYIDEATLDATIIGEDAAGSGSSFTIDAGNNEIDDAGHGYGDSDVVIFTGTGTNAQISKNTIYYAEEITVNAFKIHLDHALSGAVTLTDTTTTNMTNHSPAGDLDPYDNEGFPNVALRHIIQSFFVKSGLNDLSGAEVDVTDLTGNLIADNKSMNQPGTDDDPGDVDVDFDEIRLDKNMFYATNQDFAFNSEEIETNDIDGDTQAKKVTFKDYLSRIFPLFYLVIYYQDGFIIERQTSEGSYSLADDDQDSYNKITIPARLDAATWEMKANSVGGGASLRDLYAETLETDLSVIYTNKGKSENPLPWYNNMMFLVAGEWTGTSTAPDVDVYTPLGDGSGVGVAKNYLSPNDNENGVSVGGAYSDEATQGYVKETFLTVADTTFQNVLLNEIDPLKETSKIIEVTW